MQSGPLASGAPLAVRRPLVFALLAFAAPPVASAHVDASATVAAARTPTPLFVAAGKATFDSKLRLKVDAAKKARAPPGPLTFAPATPQLELADRPYRGQIQVTAAGAKLQAVNVVGLEPYLDGVVPSEMPHTWAPEALKAQAVAARSYALANLKTGAFDLFPDTRSQVYGGGAAEQPETNAAVQATAGQVALYAGRVAKTFFFSTSGGRTAASADAFGTAVPYLVSVPDPYDSISPYHDWGPFAFSAAKLARVLHVHKPIQDVQTTLNSSGRVLTMTVLTPLGPHLFDGNALRQVLGLRSTWFTIGVLSLSGPSTPLTYGSSTALTGVA